MIGIKNQTFGLELEFSGMTRQNAARAIAKVITGTDTEPTYEGGAYYKWTVKDAKGRKWIVERDASVDNINGGEKCEFVTPKCEYEDMETVQECIRALRKAGAAVNQSCGIHVHVDGANHNEKTLKNLVFTFRAKEDLIFKAVGTQQRRLAKWCKPIDDSIVDNIKEIKKLDNDSMRKAWYDTYSDSWRSTTEHYHGSRYHALNLHSFWYRGTVEFRLFESTLHAGEVRAYISLVLAMSAAAINAKRASASVLDTAGNDKYAFRCFLLRLGLIGDEYKNVRMHLLKNLEGNAAWRNDPTTYDSYNNRRGA